MKWPNSEKAKRRNGEMALKIRVQVITYNRSDKIIERSDKRSQHSTAKFTLYLFDINSQRLSVSVHVCQISCVKLIAKLVRF